MTVASQRSNPDTDDFRDDINAGLARISNKLGRGVVVADGHVFASLGRP